MSNPGKHTPEWEYVIDYQVTTGDIHHAMYRDVSLYAPKDNPEAYRVKSFDSADPFKTDTRPDTYYPTIEQASANLFARAIDATRKILETKHELHPFLAHDSSVTVFDQKLYSAPDLKPVQWAGLQEDALASIREELDSIATLHNVMNLPPEDVVVNTLMNDPDFLKEAMDAYDMVDHSVETDQLHSKLEELVVQYSEKGHLQAAETSRPSLDARLQEANSRKSGASQPDREPAPDMDR